MATRLEETEVAGGWEPVPPGHPDRAAYEDRMRALGIRPATRWEPRHDRKVFKKPGWRAWLRARLGR
jgi:hypothetical protein